MSEEDWLWVECSDCGEEYPIGGRMGYNDSPERSYHHDEDCPIHDALQRQENDPLFNVEATEGEKGSAKDIDEHLYGESE